MRKMLSTKDLQTAESGTTNITLNGKCSNAKYNTDDVQVIPQKERSVKVSCMYCRQSTVALTKRYRKTR